jgi:hypothetical protein
MTNLKLSRERELLLIDLGLRRLLDFVDSPEYEKFLSSQSGNGTGKKKHVNKKRAPAPVVADEVKAARVPLSKKKWTAEHRANFLKSIRKTNARKKKERAAAVAEQA